MKSAIHCTDWKGNGFDWYDFSFVRNTASSCALRQFNGLLESFEEKPPREPSDQVEEEGIEEASKVGEPSIALPLVGRVSIPKFSRNLS